LDRSRIRILIVDDHEIFRAGLRLLLENEPDLNVIGEAHNKTEAFQAVRNLPDVILLDLDLGAEMATDFLPDLVKAGEPARVLVLTGVSDPELHFHAVCLGAIGVVHKLEAPQLLLKAIRKVHEGEVWMNRDMVARAMSHVQRQGRAKTDPDAAKISNLTARELEIITTCRRRPKKQGHRRAAVYLGEDGAALPDVDLRQAPSRRPVGTDDLRLPTRARDAAFPRR